MGNRLVEKSHDAHGERTGSNQFAWTRLRFDDALAADERTIGTPEIFKQNAFGCRLKSTVHSREKTIADRQDRQRSCARL